MRSLPKISVENPALVGVVMMVIIVAGIYVSMTLTREMFPESRPDAVLITTLYPGASPEEIEKGIAKRIEDAIRDVDGLERIETTIQEGVCAITIEMESDYDDIDQAVTDFKAAVDAIPSDELPEDAEKTTVTKIEPILPVISVAVFGDFDEQTLKDYAYDIEDELLRLPEISRIEISGIRKSELTVEVQPEKMVEYGLSLSEVASTIGRTNLDLPGGQVKTADMNIAVRTLGETDQTDAIANTILRTTPDGEVVRVADLGSVIDGFEDQDIRGRFNGLPAVDITIYKTGDQDAIRISNQVKAYVAGKMGQSMPANGLIAKIRQSLGIKTQPQTVHENASTTPFEPGLQLATHSNLSKYIEGRLDLLKRNGFLGLILVFLSLLTFLNWRVAVWVLMGLIVSMLGALVMMQIVGATLNLISAFGLIVVLGIIVDDAIIVGENVFARVERGDDPKHAAIIGAQEVTWPVLIAVLTTIGAFAPLMFIAGRIGNFMGVLPVVVICALSVSLIEALAILPSHLAESLHKSRKRPPNPVDESSKPSTGLIMRFRAKQSHIVGVTMPNAYENFLRKATKYRYVTIGIALSMLLIAAGLFKGGRVPFVFIQKMDSETITANLEMPIGTPADRTAEMLERIENATATLNETNELNSMFTIVGAQLLPGAAGFSVSSRSHLGQIIIELPDLDQRTRTSEEIVNDLRKKTGNPPGVDSITFKPMMGGPGGAEIEIQVTGDDLDRILDVANVLKKELSEFDGIFDIDDDFETGQREIQLELLDSARALGITTRSLATEVRGAFFGLEARTLQRDNEDIDIRVRFPESRRAHIHDLESMRIATPTGQLVPLVEVARITEGQGYSSIRRVDQQRAVTISADADQARANPDEVLAELLPKIATLKAANPGTDVEFVGNKRETAKSFGSLKRDFAIALVLIYVMLVGLFKSYIHPLVVLFAVPFGLIGAITGHFVMGYPLTILSVIGLVALTGIVVNDSLILVDFINKEISEGKEMYEAVIHGGRRRLRPILLTSLTTILGLAPLMAETSFQARFLIPMAISISFGLAFATLLTLVVVPSIYLVAEDLRKIYHKVRPIPGLLPNNELGDEKT